MDSLQYHDTIDRAAHFLKTRIPVVPDWCVILGSGLGGLGDRLTDPLSIPYDSIPGFPGTTVQGHAGKLVVGTWSERSVAVMEGRFHAYEGHDGWMLVLPVRVLMMLGTSRFCITNAAGGIRADIVPGDLMLISDHINLLGSNPLTGPNLADFGVRFPAMTACYDEDFRSRIAAIARKRSVPMTSGVYAALPGPSYETNAEITMLRLLGADAVGMSTVPEVIAIRHANRRVVAISLITNATGGGSVPTHEEVVALADTRRSDLHGIILELISMVE
ncbi:purine-nucleoside phosphorylase [bacterium]|nr:purine-nucleoside phosphorylase [candidate division CSSED10-310 bacterium]